MIRSSSESPSVNIGIGNTWTKLKSTETMWREMRATLYRYLEPNWGIVQFWMRENVLVSKNVIVFFVFVFIAANKQQQTIAENISFESNVA